MAQGERRAKAVLAAAVAWHDSSVDHSQEKLGELNVAIAKYKEVLAAKLPEDPSAFYCPHCEALKPAYTWDFNAADTGPFALAYLTCFCAQCKKIISVSVTTFLPSKGLAETLAKSFAALMGKPQA